MHEVWSPKQRKRDDPTITNHSPVANIANDQKLIPSSIFSSLSNNFLSIFNSEKIRWPLDNFNIRQLADLSYRTPTAFGGLKTYFFFFAFRLINEITKILQRDVRRKTNYHSFECAIGCGSFRYQNQILKVLSSPSKGWQW